MMVMMKIKDDDDDDNNDAAAAVVAADLPPSPPRHHRHYSGTMAALWGLKSLSTRLFGQQLFQSKNKENVKLAIIGP